MIFVQKILTAHTISPFRWNFKSSEYRMIDDGVIELRIVGTDNTIFKYVDVSDAKLTDENNIMCSQNPSLLLS